MAITNSGTGIKIDANGGNISNLLLSNVNIQDKTIYTVTSLKDGSDTNGDIIMTKASGCIGNFESSHTILCKSTYILNGLTTDIPINNLHLNLKDVKFITKTQVTSDIITPMKGNRQTQIHFKGNGCTWNSKHPDTELIGSTLFFEAGGDGHLGKHKDAIIKDVNMLWKSKTRNEFILGMQQNWDNTNKPSPMEGLRFISNLGNDYISFFTWENPLTPADINNIFLVNPDWCYDVALPGTRPTKIRRSYRRGNVTCNSKSYWGNIILNPTYLWIDPYTTISDNGIIDNDKIYLKNIDYNALGTMDNDNASDIIVMRFNPTVMQKNGNTLENVNISVINNSTLTLFNNIGNLYDKLSCIGITNNEGKIIISEPEIKNYDDTFNNINDSIVIKNRVANKYHKWWEKDTKLIIVHDTRNTIGKNVGITYNDFTISFRKIGYVFENESFNFDTPYFNKKELIIDNNYNNDIQNNNDIIITYNNKITNVELPNKTVTLDEIYNAIINFHGNLNNTMVQTLLPIKQNNGDIFEFDNNLNLIFKDNTLIIKGKKNIKINTNSIINNNIEKIKIDFVDSNGKFFKLICNCEFSIYGQIINSISNEVISNIEFQSCLDYKNISLKDDEVLYCLISGFGYKSKLFILDVNSNFEIYLEKEQLLNTDYTIEYLESIKSYFRTVVDSESLYAVELMGDMSDFTPNEFLAGFAWWIYKYGDLVSIIKYNLLKNGIDTDIFNYGESKIIINMENFIVRVTNDINTNRDDGYYIPIMIISNGNFKSVKLNTHGINLSMPRYTKIEADISTKTLETISNTIKNSISTDESINKINLLENKMNLVTNKINSIDSINEEISKIKTITKKPHGTKIS